MPIWEYEKAQQIQEGILNADGSHRREPEPCSSEGA